MQPVGCVINLNRSDVKISKMLAASSLALVTILSGCASESDYAETSSSESLILYSGRNEALIAPLLELFTEETGIEVSVRYGESAEMAATIIEEGANVAADAFLSQDAGALGALSAAGSVKKLPADLLDSVPSEYRAGDGSWIGVSGRARVLNYNPDLVTTLPASVFDLADPGWKGRIAIAPTNASFQSFVTGMRVTAGDEATLAFLSALKENAVIYEKNGQILDAVESGEVAAGLINHYYWYEKSSEVGEENMKSKLNWFETGDAGNLVNVAGISILSENPAAIEFASWLLGDTAQEYFLQNTFEYSLTSNTPPSPSLPNLDEIEGPNIDLSDLSSLSETLELLAKAGLI
jgi:iron(III) transport system substrate-binding protein